MASDDEHDNPTGGEDKIEIVEAWNEVIPKYQQHIKLLVWEDVATALAEELISPEDVSSYDEKQCGHLAGDVEQVLKLSIKAGVELVGLLCKISKGEGKLASLLCGCTSCLL